MTLTGQLHRFYNAKKLEDRKKCQDMDADTTFCLVLNELIQMDTAIDCNTICHCKY